MIAAAQGRGRTDGPARRTSTASARRRAEVPAETSVKCTRLQGGKEAWWRSSARLADSGGTGEKLTIKERYRRTGPTFMPRGECSQSAACSLHLPPGLKVRTGGKARTRVSQVPSQVCCTNASKTMSTSRTPTQVNDERHKRREPAIREKIRGLRDPAGHNKEAFGHARRRHHVRGRPQRP